MIRIIQIFDIRRLLLLLVLICAQWNLALAQDFAPGNTSNADAYSRIDVYLLSQNEQDASGIIPPASGTLLLPADNSNGDTSDKKCMTVCANWGEECSYINKGSGGTTRICRRTCQQYKKESF
jgi:hypothetical protein